MRAVLATDLSDAIESAISSRVCLECLGRYGITDIDLVTVTSPNVTTGMPGSDVGKQTKRALERQANLLETEDFDVTTHVMRGAPFRRINGLADRVHADLIIVGSRGKSPLRERLIGGTTRDMARTATRPLLVQRIVEAGEDLAVANEHLFQRVLFATDFSENADRAFDQFAHLKNATQEARIVHVAPPERREDAEGIEDTQARLDELATELGSKGVDVSTEVRYGDPANQILEAEAAFDPTTILLGSRGRGRIRRLLLGSTSEAVTARSDSNVLLVPPAGAR
jgi:nucleotide-binding universal stress UspA family protein